MRVFVCLCMCVLCQLGTLDSSLRSAHAEAFDKAVAAEQAAAARALAVEKQKAEDTINQVGQSGNARRKFSFSLERGINTPGGVSAPAISHLWAC